MPPVDGMGPYDLIAKDPTKLAENSKERNFKNGGKEC
jgi:hypothetical protein